MAKTKSFSYLATFLLPLIINFPNVFAIYPAEIPKRDISALVNHPVTLSCLTQDSEPIQSCRWERRPLVDGKRYLINVFDNSTRSLNSPTCNCTYEYSGTGLDHGDCSITIRNVTRFHLTQWECLLTSKDKGLFFGKLNVTELEPVMPYFEDTEGTVLNELEANYNESFPGSRTDVTCCVSTAATNTLVNPNLTITVSNGTNSTSLFQRFQQDIIFIRRSKVCRHTSYTFSPRYNNESLHCHVTYIHQSNEYEASTRIPLVVNFPPTFSLSSDYIFQGLLTNDVSSVLELNVTFSSNPKPRFSWYFVHDKGNNQSFEIRFDHPKYKQKLYNLEGDIYVASLQIRDFQEKEDYNRSFYLSLSNPFGGRQILVESMAPSASLPGNENGTYWIMIIVAVGAVVVAAFLVVVVCLVVTRLEQNRKGKYAPTPVKYESRTGSGQKQVEEGEGISTPAAERRRERRQWQEQEQELQEIPQSQSS